MDGAVRQVHFFPVVADPDAGVFGVGAEFDFEFDFGRLKHFVLERWFVQIFVVKNIFFADKDYLLDFVLLFVFLLVNFVLEAHVVQLG